MKSFFIPISIAIKNLQTNFGRTFLSLLGIVIGVMSIVIVLSFGMGLKEYIFSQLEVFGTDYVEIETKIPNTKQTSSQNAGSMVGGMQITTFKLENAEEIAKLPNVSEWYAGNMGQGIMSYRENNKNVMLLGTTPGISQVDQNFQVTEGEIFTEKDDEEMRQAIILGSKIKKTLFGDASAIGESVKINKHKYKVLGVLKEKGNSGVFDFDELVYVPLQTLQKKILGIDYITFAMFQVEDLSKMEITKLEMIDIMRNEHDISDSSDDDFAVMSVEEAVDLLNDIFAVVDVLLIALTSISLVVGGIGITNVMYIAVTERTFEIGLRKSIGAKKADIFRQFLFEAILITFMGGALGILMGSLISKIVEYIALNFGFTLNLPLSTEAVFISIIFSIITGVLFGIRPAMVASRLSPAEAMRKE